MLVARASSVENRLYTLVARHDKQPPSQRPGRVENKHYTFVARPEKQPLAQR